MKKIIKRTLMGISFLLVLTIGTFLLCIFNPQWTYAKSTEHGHFRILHHEDISADLLKALDAAEVTLQRSELYSDEMRFKICLNDGQNTGC